MFSEPENEDGLARIAEITKFSSLAGAFENKIGPCPTSRSSPGIMIFDPIRKKTNSFFGISFKLPKL